MQGHTIWMDGELRDAAEATVSVLDHGLLYGDGVFEGIRFYDRRPFRLDEHLARLERSAAAIDLRLPYDRRRLADATRLVSERAADADGYLRLVATRGRGSLGIDPRSCPRPTVFVIAGPLRMYADARQRGIDVIVASTRQAPLDALDPRIKGLSYLGRLLARLEAVRAGAAEAILLDHRGRVTEASTENVFVVRGGVLMTPPASDGALEGITRAVVLELACELGIPLREASIGAYDLRHADEAMLAGTGAELLPVRRVDGVLLGACPGPVFTRLDAAFQSVVRAEITGPRR